MHVFVIGGKGHIGGYLVPRLVEAGYQVTCLTRGKNKLYRTHGAWNRVRESLGDRDKLDKTGALGKHIASFKPDAVIDLICFTPESAKHLVESLRGHVQHFLHCGTIWVHGPSAIVPTTEAQPRAPFGDYGVQKEKIETYLLDEARRGNFPATVLHPGHIVGPGWNPLNPQGHFNPDVFTAIAAGVKLVLPNLGMETVHHVHADDVAQAFMLALQNWSASVGESFHIVSPQALTLRGYAEGMSAWFGYPQANLDYKPWDEWKETVSEKEAKDTEDHIRHSPNCSIAKAQRLLGYQPRYSSLQAVQESVQWLIGEHVVKA